MNRDPYRYGAPEGELPLEHLVPDGGYTSIFRTVACVGDSLSSGEHETRVSGQPTGYHDLYEHSWGQYLARMAGCLVYNFSCGGLTASAYCEGHAAAMGWLDPEKSAQAYIIALGVNDIVNQNQEPGTVADIRTDDPAGNAKTFTGYYARIIQTYKALSPDAKFFLVTPPVHPAHAAMGLTDRFATVRACILELAAFFDNCYVIDLFTYAPAHDDRYRSAFYLHHHLNAAGYRMAAEEIGSYIDYIIRHHHHDFKNVGFIGNKTPMLC